MKTWGRILLPLGLGLAAGLFNLIAINLKVSPRRFAAVNRDFVVGESIGEGDLKALSLSGDIEQLKTSAVLYESRSVLYGKRVVRPLKANDLMLLTDALQTLELQPDIGEDSLPVSMDDVPNIPNLLLVGETIGFIISKRDTTTGINKIESAEVPEYIGPFRLLSVGDRLSRSDIHTSEAGGRSSDGRVIHVGIRFKEVDGAKILEDSSQKLAMALSRGSTRITALVLHGRRIELQPTSADAGKESTTTGAQGNGNEE